MVKIERSFPAPESLANKLYSTLEEMEEHPESQFALRKARALLRKESKFAAFKRCYVRENAARYPYLQFT